ncbi:NmrA family NAD(P)-binding protein [Pseudomonas huanghezhanensis]|uniref:NmrA family NAD(P)-binding protein n=1 Tax=Pseudomonas huanghezhanensis TaxID=3002903 RepID=UPI002286A27C|nr:NmrA family NAD(P)-binding protein [Pseudomonas sp. BSw22131]
MNHATALPIVVAGATGDLGHRVVRALAERGAHVIALVRPGVEQVRLNGLRNSCTTITPVSLDDAQGLRRAIAGSGCVVSTLNGLEEVIIEQQCMLLEAAVAAGVPRFIPSDYSLDYTRTRPGDNRNLDLRRRFATLLDRADITVTSILNGGFLELLEGDAPIVLPGRRVLHFGDAQQPLDFTAKDDVASFTADAALDPHTPRFLRIAGNTLPPAQIARILTELTGQRYRTLRPGNIGTLSALIYVVRALTPSSEKPFPAWQGMQYLRDMMSGRGKLLNLDNDRYGQRKWASVHDTLARTHVQGMNQ